MKRSIILSLAMALCLPMVGNTIDESTAKQMAQNFWNGSNIMGVRDGKVFKRQMDEAQFVNVAPQCGYSEFFIFNNENGNGYVIIAADDCVTPVLGYSYENGFTPNDMPPALKAWLDDYAEQIHAAVSAKASATAEIKHDWECLRQGKPLPIRSQKAVSPLVQTKWNQSPYVNDQCPYDYNANQRTVTGCVATAMAQIMRYWSYPEHGFGSHSYTPASHPEYGSLYLDFSAVDYQWSAMPTAVNSTNYAVATLMYHCGVSVDMDYGISGSPDYGSAAYILAMGSTHPCAEIALKTYFNYKSTLHGELKQQYSDTDWTNLLKNELDNARPIMYGGFGSGGHAFICDGYDYNGYFHFNWGWGGHYNDYFYINNLNPSTHNYSSNQQAIIGIEPNDNGGGGGGGTGGSSEEYNLVYHCNLSMDQNEYWFYDDFSVYAEVLNSGEGDFSGYIGAGVFRKNEEGEYRFVDVMSYWDCISEPLETDYYFYGNLHGAGGPPYTPGSYYIAMLYSLDGELWNFIDELQYHDVYFDIVYSTDIETNSNFSIMTGDYLYFSETATVNVDIRNSGTTTFYGNFRVNLAYEDGSWAQDIAILNCSSGLAPNYHYTGGIDFTGEITVAPGSYYIELAFQRPGNSSWYYAGASQYPNPVSIEVAAPAVTRDPYEANNTVSNAYNLPVQLNSSTATITTPGSNLHDINDIDYYKIELNPGRYTIKPRLHDSYNSGDGSIYTVDAKFAYSTDGTNWSDYYDDEITSNIISEGGTLYFCVVPYFEGKTGTYLFSINVSTGTGIDEFSSSNIEAYPNPVGDMLNISCHNAKEIKLFNSLGVLVKSLSTQGKEALQIDMTDLPAGIYVLEAIDEQRTSTKRLVKAQ